MVRLLAVLSALVALPLTPARSEGSLAFGIGVTSCANWKVILIEQADRLSRLTAGDWEKLKAEIAARHIRVVALDLPTSWMMTTANGDEFTGRMFDAINNLMLDMLAAMGRKDYEDPLAHECPNRCAQSRSA